MGIPQEPHRLPKTTIVFLKLVGTHDEQESVAPSQLLVVTKPLLKPILTN